MADEKKVVGLFGDIPQPGEVNQNALKALEEALEKVKGGEVIGVIIAMAFQDNTTSAITGGFCKGRAVAGLLFELMQDATRRE